MYASVRIFRVTDGEVDRAEQETWDACRSALPRQPGFRHMYSIRSGANEFLTIGIYESRDTAVASMAEVNPVFLSAVSRYLDGEPLRYHGPLRDMVDEGWDEGLSGGGGVTGE